MTSLFRKGRKTFKNLAVIAFFLSAPTYFANASSSEENSGEKFSPSEMIMHHIQDTHEFHIWGDLALPLPVILYTDHGLDLFMSGGFYHGDGVITTPKGSYELHHEKSTMHIVEMKAMLVNL